MPIPRPDLAGSWRFDGPARLCEVELGGSLLSGCAIANSLVVTCAHTTGQPVPLGGQALVRRQGPDGATEVVATTVFLGSEVDVRLLYTHEPVVHLAYPVPWGGLLSDAVDDCRVWGAPTASMRGNGDLFDGACMVESGAGGSRRLTVRLRPRSVRTDSEINSEKQVSDAALWAGMSGGPVAHSGRLVGLVRAVDGRFDALEVLTSSALLGAEGRWLEAEGDGFGGVSKAGTLRAAIWAALAEQVAASNRGLLVPVPVTPVGPPGGPAMVLEAPVVPPLDERLRPIEALQYRHAVVPLIEGDPVTPRVEHGDVTTGHSETVESILDQFLNGEVRFDAAMLTGAGGMGKSRAAQELMIRAAEAGWTIGLTRGGLAAAAEGAGLPAGPLLVVVDYPEDSPTEVGRWMEAMMRSAGGSGQRVRVLLLSRRRGSLVSAMVRELTLDAEDVRPLGQKGTGDLSALASSARHQFRRLGLDVAAVDAGRPVSAGDTTLLALASVLVGGTAAKDVFAKLLARERRFWRRHLVRTQSQEAVSDEVLDRAVAGLSLGGNDGPAAAAVRLAQVGVPSECREAVVDGFPGLYGPGFAALHPDPVADHLIRSTLTPNDLFVAALASEGRQAIEVLSSIARTVTATDPGDFAQDLRWCLVDFAQQFGGWLNAEFTRLDGEDGGRPTALGLGLAAARLVDALPWGDHPALDSSVGSVLAREISALNSLESAVGTEASNLAIPQQHLAVSIDRQQQRVARAQAEQNPAYQPNLAMALNNLANRLAETGDRAGALPPAQEAVTLRRAQAEQNPAYQPNLAMALNNLANRLAETGDRAGALPPAQEAVTLYERLAAEEPVYADALAQAKETLRGLQDAPE